ncbi:phosphatidylserine decarboxylase, partial [Bermanella sp. 47_1433_sub80_T6]
MNKDSLFVMLQYVIPQHTFSRLVGWFASTEIGFIKDTFITKFAKKYQVNMD